MKRWAWISGMGMVVLAALGGWRETGHNRDRGLLAAERDRARMEAAACSEERALLTERVAEAETALEGAAVREQSLGDRVANLEAQRAHLKAEAERQRQRVGDIERLNEAAQAELQEVRRELLEQSALPRELRARLEMSTARLAEAEAELDTLRSGRANAPEGLQVEGLSTDGRVFALSGELHEAETLPRPVLLCRRNSILLDGWLHRLEDGLAIGHVDRWRVPASTLVKGEKVFILRRNEREADHP